MRLIHKPTNKNKAMINKDYINKTPPNTNITTMYAPVCNTKAKTKIETVNITK